MRVLWFVFALVFLQPAYSDSTVEECKSEASRLRRVAELRDSGLNAFDGLQHMAVNWDEIADDEKKLVVQTIVIVFHTQKHLKPSELHKVFLSECFKQNGITNT